MHDPNDSPDHRRIDRPRLSDAARANHPSARRAIVPHDRRDPPPAFDAATIKPHSPEARSSWLGIRDTPEGMNAISATLQSLVHSAYGLRIFDQISGGPDWAKADHFDVQAKMSEADIVGMQKLSPAEATARRQLMLRVIGGAVQAEGALRDQTGPGL